MSRGVELLSFALLGGLLIGGCGQGNAYLDHPATKKPNPNNVVGKYVLVKQTIIPGDLSILQGQQCTLELKADGSFRAENYPIWSETRDHRNRLDSLASIQGRWQVNIVGSIGDDKSCQDCWGIEFSETDHEIGDLGLMGKNAPPYSLIHILGDPDSNEVMIFAKHQ